MRLQLSLLFSCLALAGCGASAPPSEGAVTANLRAGLYQDSDRTTITSGTVAVRARPSSEWTIGARYLVDVTSSASVDVVSAATGRWFEGRHEAAPSVGWSDGWTSVDVGYVYSLENDWESHTGSFGLSQDLDEHNVTLSLGGAYVYNAIWRSGDPTFSREQQSVTANAAIAFVPNPSELWSFRYTFTWVDGYQASPYRFARLGTSNVADVLLFMPETHPETRYRHALTIRWNAAVSDDVAFRSHLRAYYDDWGIASATLGTEVNGALGDGFELGAMLRAYGQLHASFYRDVYEQPMRYMTSDRELSSFLDAFAGPQVMWRGHDEGPFSELRVDTKVVGFFFWFPEFSRLPYRYGLVVELGLGGDF